MSKHRRSPVAPRALPLLGSAALAAGLLPFTAEAALAAPPVADVGVATQVADVPSGAPAADDHVGLALAGLGGLGLAGVGTAGLVVFRRSEEESETVTS